MEHGPRIPLCLKRRFSLLRISSIAGLVCTLPHGADFAGEVSLW